MAGVGQQRQAVGDESGDQLGEKIKPADDQRPFKSLRLVMPLHGAQKSMAQGGTAIKHAMLILAGSTVFSRPYAASFDWFCEAPGRTSGPDDSCTLPCSRPSRRLRSRCRLFADREWLRRYPD